MTKTGEWQTIDTAPDALADVRVWIWNGDKPHQGVQAIYADGDWWRYRRKIGGTSVPSHWMAIDVPAPPEVKPRTPTDRPGVEFAEAFGEK